MSRVYEVWNGDSVELLKQIPDNSIHAIVTDPPYGLGKVPDIRVVLDHWLSGREYRPTGGGFMGAEWDAFVPFQVWSECYRVLRPGGFCVAFSGTRTVDLLGLAMRLAGFEVRDLFSWNQFQGFPKSLDISKAIDDHYGAVREVVGRGAYQSRRPNPVKHSNIPGAEYGFGAGHTITAPATKDAQTWAGYGSGLKPAFEPAIFARKPLDGTYAHNVMKWGAGALNIDRCRYPYSKGSGWIGPNEGQQTTTHSVSGTNHATSYKMRAMETHQTEGQKLGRYPSNTYATPKASRAEREAGLTAQNMLCSCKPGGRTWANADRNQNTTSEKAQSREPDTTESRDAGGLLWRTAGTGNNGTGLSPPGMTSTTSTETDSTTDLKTCNSSQNLNTRGSTLDVKSGTAFGGSLAVNAKSSSQSPKSTGTSKERGRSTGGVAHVTSESLSSPSVCGVCGKRKKASTGASATRRKEGTKGLNSPRAGAGRTAEAVLNLHPT